MMRMKNIAPEEMGEVTRIASELYDRETQEARERQATADAVAEVGIPQEYMERAAEQVFRERVGRIQARRKRGRLIAAAAAGIALIGGGFAYVNRPAPAPLTVSVSAATIGKNPESVADVTSGPGSTQRLTVRHFGAAADGQYYANLNFPLPASTSLSGYRAVTFTLGGTGIPQTRLFIENGPTERWKSPVIAVPPVSKTMALDLDEFVHQTRSSSAAPWRDVGVSRPGPARTLSFKVGEKINPPTTAGEMAVGEPQFR